MHTDLFGDIDELEQREIEDQPAQMMIFVLFVVMATVTVGMVAVQLQLERETWSGINFEESNIIDDKTKRDTTKQTMWYIKIQPGGKCFF